MGSGIPSFNVRSIIIYALSINKTRGEKVITCFDCDSERVSVLWDGRFFICKHCYEKRRIEHEKWIKENDNKEHY